MWHTVVCAMLEMPSKRELCVRPTSYVTHPSLSDKHPRPRQACRTPSAQITTLPARAQPLAVMQGLRRKAERHRPLAADPCPATRASRRGRRCPRLAAWPRSMLPEELLRRERARRVACPHAEQAKTRSGAQTLQRTRRRRAPSRRPGSFDSASARRLVRRRRRENPRGPAAPRRTKHETARTVRVGVRVGQA